MIKIPLIDLDSSMTVQNLQSPNFPHEISKTLTYNIGGNNLAVNKGN